MAGEKLINVLGTHKRFKANLQGSICVNPLELQKNDLHENYPQQKS